MKSKVTLRQKMAGKMTSLFMTAYAEENPTTNEPKETNPTPTEPTAPVEPQATTPNAPSQSNDFETLIARARKEERDKLYGEITKLKQDRENLTNVNVDLNKEISGLKADLKSAEDKVASLDEEAKSGTKSNRVVVELQGEVRKLKSDLKKAETEKEKEVSRISLENHREVALLKAQAEGAGIIPELITGSTKEEIDASIESSKARYQEIVAQTARPSNNPSPFVMPRATASGSNPAQQTYKDVASMSPAEYAEYRKEIGIK